jgi:type II secretory pathway pseudopilin PulG
VPTCPTNRRSARRREGERGFALVLLFLLAAVIAISLYYEIPRVAMESQRQKEQLLIDRGEQYKRAIQLYYNKTKRYPAEIKDLESFQNTRFLRHRYIDPMTGKDEWRLIHVQNGILTDSLVNKQGQKQGQNGTQLSTMGQFIGVQQGMGDQPTAGGGGAASVRNRTRPSDGAMANGPQGEMPPGQSGQPGQPGFPNNGFNAGMPPTGAIPGTTPGTPGVTNFPGVNNNPNGVPNIPGVSTLPPGVPGGGGPNGFPVGVPGAPGGIPVGMPGSTGRPPGATGTQTTGGSLFGSGGSLFGTTPTTTPGTNPGGTMPGAGTPGYPQPGYPTAGQPLPGQPGMPVNSQYGGVSPSPYPTTAGANGTPPGFPQPGATAGAPSNDAANLIRNILTTPRPGGMPTANGGMGQTIGGGLAGVASTSDGEGVKVYNDRTLYAEWEFIFDLQKVKQIPNPNAQGAVGTPAGQMGNTQGMGQIGQPITPSNGFGPGMGGPGGLQPPPPGLGTFPRPGGQ